MNFCGFLACAISRGTNMAKTKDGGLTISAQARRQVLRRLGRFATVTAPAVTLLLAAQTKPVGAQIISRCAAIAQPGNSKPA